MFWGIRLTGKHAIVTTVEILPTGTNLQIFHLSRSEQAAQLRIAVEDLQAWTPKKGLSDLLAVLLMVILVTYVRNPNEKLWHFFFLNKSFRNLLLASFWRYMEQCWRAWPDLHTEVAVEKLQKGPAHPDFCWSAVCFYSFFFHFFPKFWISYWGENVALANPWQLSGEHIRRSSRNPKQYRPWRADAWNQKSGVHQLRLVVYPHYLNRGGWPWDFWSIKKYHFQHGFLGLRDVRTSPELVEPIGLQVVEPELSLEAAGRWELLPWIPLSNMQPKNQEVKQFETVRMTKVLWRGSKFLTNKWVCWQPEPTEFHEALSLSMSSILRSEGKATESGSLSERPNTTFTSEYFELV